MRCIAIVVSALVPVVLAAAGEGGYGGYGGYSGYGGYGSNACSKQADCVVKPCYIVQCLYDSCVYKKQPHGTKCPGKGKLNKGPCDDDANDFCDTGGQCNDAFKPATHVCRPAANVCDVPEKCDGSCSFCPSNRFANKKTVCTSIGVSSGGLCDSVDYCDGNGKCVDGFMPKGGVCRAAVDVCDVVETCSGKTGVCPPDGFAKKGTKCSSIGLSSDRLCNDKSTCDGRGSCAETFKPAGTVCRPAASECDVPEVCPGNAGVCPENAFAPSTKSCSGTSTGGACDGDDKCDGNGACVDKYLDVDSLCYHKQTVCDGNVFCDGKSAVCPTPKAYALLTAEASTTEVVAQAVRSCATSVSSYTSTSLASLYDASMTRSGAVLLALCVCVSGLAVFAARKSQEDDAFAYYLET